MICLFNVVIRVSERMPEFMCGHKRAVTPRHHIRSLPSTATEHMCANACDDVDDVEVSAYLRASSSYKVSMERPFRFERRGCTYFEGNGFRVDLVLSFPPFGGSDQAPARLPKSSRGRNRWCNAGSFDWRRCKEVKENRSVLNDSKKLDSTLTAATSKYHRRDLVNRPGLPGAAAGS